MLKKIIGGVFFIWIVFVAIYFTRLDAINNAWIVDVVKDGKHLSLGVFDFVDLLLDKGIWALLFENMKRNTFINFDHAVWDYESGFIFNAIVISSVVAVVLYALNKLVGFIAKLPMKNRLNTLAFLGFVVVFYWTNGFHPYTTAKVLDFHFFGGVSVPMLPFESDLEQMYQYYYRVGIKQYFLNIEFSFSEKLFYGFMLFWYGWKTHLLLSSALSEVTFKDNYKASITASFTFLFFSLFAPYRLTDNGVDKEEMKDVTIYQQNKLFTLMGIDATHYLTKINDSFFVSNLRDSQSSWFKSIYRYIK